MPRLPPTLVISYGDDSHDGIPDVVRAHAEQHAMPPATLPGFIFCPTSHATYTLHSVILMSTNGTQHYSALVYARPGWTHLDDDISTPSSLDPRPDATPTKAFYTLNEPLHQPILPQATTTPTHPCTPKPAFPIPTEPLTGTKLHEFATLGHFNGYKYVPRSVEEVASELYDEADAITKGILPTLYPSLIPP